MTCTAHDAAAHEVSATFGVAVSDTMKPVIGAVADQVVEATGPNGALVTFTVSASDVVDASVAVSCLPASGSVFALGSTAVTCTATDASSNSSTLQFSVTVRDTTAPVVTCPAKVSARSATVSYEPASAVDAVSTATVSYSAASGAAFSLGVTTVTATAADAAGNASTCQFEVEVTAGDVVGADDPDGDIVGGCGCTQSGGSSLLIWALGLCLALRRRLNRPISLISRSRD